MATVSVQRNLPWLPAGATLSILSPDIPCPDALTPSVFAVCFCDDQILLVRHNRRGWDMPGGHRETGESFETTLHREVGEEACARIKNIQPLATLRIDIPGEKPEGYTYPFPLSYMRAFIAEISHLDDFTSKFETVERQLFTIDQIRRSDWGQTHRDLLQLALEMKGLQ